MTESRVLDFLRHVLRHPYTWLPGAPSGIINSARDWVIQHLQKTPADIRRGPPAAFWEIDPPVLRSLPPPNTIEESPSTRALRTFPTPRTALFFLKGARILGSDGVVISPDNRVFAEFTYVDEPGGIGHHSVFRRRRFPRARALSGWYATLCYPSSPAYFHWIVESLPRIRLLQPHLDSLDGIFVPAQLEAQMLESLHLLGVRPNQLIAMDQGSHFQAEHLLVPNYCAGLDIPDWVPPFLRAAAITNAPQSAANKRIYVSRADAGKRRVTNEAEICTLLTARGFEIVRLRELGFRAQAELFDTAEIVVGAHGAGLANIAFCRPGARLLELLPSPAIGPHVYYSLMTAAGGEYWYLNGRINNKSHDKREIHADFEVSPERLADTLDRMQVQ